MLLQYGCAAVFAGAASKAGIRADGQVFLWANEAGTWVEEAGSRIVGSGFWLCTQAGRNQGGRCQKLVSDLPTDPIGNARKF